LAQRVFGVFEQALAATVHVEFETRGGGVMKDFECGADAASAASVGLADQVDRDGLESGAV
jgi:hypothetical protein